MNRVFNGASAFKQRVQYWTLNTSTGVPSLTDMFASSGMVGNNFDLTTPTPLKSEFDPARPDAIPNSAGIIQSLVTSYVQILMRHNLP